MDIRFTSAITPQQFNHFFETQNVDGEALLSLAAMAAGGHQGSIDMLLQLALQKNARGDKAESMLFTLFSDSTVSLPGIEQQIAASALELYTLHRNNKLPFVGRALKMTHPSALLYMAGSAANMGQKGDIAAILNQDIARQCGEELLADSDLWHLDRRLSSDEIYQSLLHQHNGQREYALNYPIGLIHPKSRENTLVEQILQQCQDPLFLQHTELYPINIGDHWVVLGLYQTPSPDAERRAFIFDSANALDSTSLRHLKKACELAGVETASSLTLIQHQLQQHMPNGCGVFAAEAIAILMRETPTLPEVELNGFADAFLELSPEQQAAFNRTKRCQMYENAFLRQDREPCLARNNTMNNTDSLMHKI